MYHLVYTSTAVAPFSEEALLQMLEKCRQANKKVDVTGMLLYTRRKFIQVIEGERSVVRKLYAKIEDDDRHERIALVVEGESEERIFKDWAMGFKKLKDQEFESLVGFTDIDDFFKGRDSIETTNLVLTFLKLFYKMNIVDYPESIL
jgi:uncharacterized Fe-S cluster-containing MiaB family protein